MSPRSNLLQSHHAPQQDGKAGSRSGSPDAVSTIHCPQMSQGALVAFIISHATRISTGNSTALREDKRRCPVSEPTTSSDEPPAKRQDCKKAVSSTSVARGRLSKIPTDPETFPQPIPRAVGNKRKLVKNRRDLTHAAFGRLDTPERGQMNDCGDKVKSNPAVSKGSGDHNGRIETPEEDDLPVEDDLFADFDSGPPAENAESHDSNVAGNDAGMSNNDDITSDDRGRAADSDGEWKTASQADRCDVRSQSPSPLYQPFDLYSYDQAQDIYDSYEAQRRSLVVRNP